MKRILVVGCSGAGKSTLARQLSQLVGIPAIQLDAHYWQECRWKHQGKAQKQVNNLKA
ncbi:P-loop NTPase family protein [Peribacillus glennii]|uniref:hypothetical protein n=1 Tax=Peribacillus glennii TaxID=2303991 RepID=UPI001314744E|nr:hypothetical protein [Peribacillus glennii]